MPDDPKSRTAHRGTTANWKTVPLNPSTNPSFISLTATDLSAVRGARRVFAGVSFTLAVGELMAVTGANGSGKSTLLRLVAGLLRPAAGRILLEPQGDSVGERMHYLGHLDGLKPALTVRQNLGFWADLWGGTAGIDAALEAVGLEMLGHLPVAVLSAGQRRRAALARLLTARRPLWLLDEPATALDQAAEAGLGHLIDAHLADGGMAMVATHLELPIRPTRTLRLGAA